MANIDDRGHEKAELVMFDPQAPNFQVFQGENPLLAKDPLFCSSSFACHLEASVFIPLVSLIHRISHKLSFESRQLYILKEFSFETFAEHSKPGSMRGSPSWLPAGQRRQGWQEEPVRPGGAGRGGPEGRPVHQGHRWQQAHSHC